MKILFLITRADHGGAQVAVLDIVKNLPRGYEALVAAGEHGFLEDECKSAGVRFRYVPGLVQPINPLLDIRALLELRSLIREEEPDLIHSHTSKAGILGRLIAWLTNVPSVFTAHTWSFDEGVPRIQQLLSIPLERLAGRLQGKIITVSDANTRKALACSVASPDKLVRIWNGIPDSNLRATPGTQEIVTIISVARMVPQKDFFTLLHSVAGMPGNWRLQLVGDGPQRDELEALASDYNLQDRVEFLGRRLDVAALLANADIFVLSSKWEGLPISILEAMRAGLPVVASNVGGVRESVINGVNGFITRPQDPAELRARIEALVCNPELLARMGRAGRKRFEMHFHIDAAISKTLDVYASVCAKKSGQLLSVQTEELG